jgi:VWFA-related protein
MTTHAIKCLIGVPLICGLLCLADSAVVYAQSPALPAQKQDVEVLRVNTELVQSPVMIFDKQGHFVDGLQKEQFQLLVDGHPQAIAFFDRVTAGTPAEAIKLENARKATGVSAVGPPAKGSVYGRTLIFFVDDLHLTADSINRTRAALLTFINQSLGQNDRALITTGSGQIGFLQQLTDNKDVLRAAADKLRARTFLPEDNERPPMGPYQALSIETNDSNVLKYYVEMYFADVVQNMNKDAPEMPGNKNNAAIAQEKGEMGRRIAENHIRSRARNILNQYTAITSSSFAALRYLMASSTEFSGSKLIFVISDGFYMNRGVAGEQQKLNEITSAALRAGAVIYSIQASGLGSTFPDAKADLRQGPRMPMELPRVGSDSALQAPLYTLAVDTGGRALFNSNSMDGSIRQALNETSEYYLLAWRPETAEQRSDSLRQIQVTVKDHPELTVRVHKGYLPAAAKVPAEATAAASPTSAKASSSAVAVANSASNSTQVVEAKMIEALSTLYPIPDLPTSVNVRFSDEAGKGAALMVATEISTGNLFRATLDSADSRTVDMMGAVLDDQGKTVANFKGQLKAVAPSATAGDSISQTTEVKIKPGLYQVRVAAREPRTGVTGSASQWVLVPDLTKGQIALSSLFLGDRQPRPDTDSRVPLSISHHFTPASRLRFFASIYNAARGPNSNARPDLTLQASILRDNQSLFTSPLVKIATEGVDDLDRIPYAAEISLRTLSPGSYVLQVIATDNLSKTSATQRAKFVVE